MVPTSLSSERRGFLKEYLLVWLYPVVWKGSSNKLSVDDVPALTRQMKAETIIPKALKAWEKHHSICMVIYEISFYDLLIGVITSTIAGISLVIVRPLLLGLIIDELKKSEESGPENSLLREYAGQFGKFLQQSDGNDNDGYTLALLGILLICVLFEGACTVAMRHAFAEIVGHSMYTAVAGLIQHKMQRLQCSSSSSMELGLIGNDLFRVYESLRFGCQAVLALVGLIGGIIVLSLQLGITSSTGIAVMLLIIFCNMFLGHWASLAEEEDLKAADKRLEILKQMITGIKAIKLCAWEESFLANILAARNSEEGHLTKYRLLSQFSVQIGRACPVLSAASSFLFFALRGEEVSAAKLFAAFNVFLALRISMIVIPESVSEAAAAKMRFKRIHNYLMQDELQNYSGKKNLYVDDMKEKDNESPEDSSSENMSLPAVSIGGKFHWPENPLFKLDFQGSEISIPHGKSLAVVSKVGNGKTTFLHALLGELKSFANEKSYIRQKCDDIAYVPQKPFILGETISENITLTKNPADVDQKLLTLALERSALVTDLKLFRNGIKTAIGENGINFSGGQQQRVAIARAIYHSLGASGDNGVLMVVDDALAAVDVNVADHLLHKAFLQHLKENDKNVLVMALNQPKYLKHFDYVLVLDEGKVSNFLPVTIENLEKLNLSSVKNQTVLVDGVMAEDKTSEKAEENTDDDLYELDYNAVGGVSSGVAMKWIKSMGYVLFVSCLISGIVAYSFMAFSDFWFALWIEKVELRDDDPSLSSAQRKDDLEFVAVYATSCTCYLIFLLITSGLFTYAGVKGSTTLHKEAITKLLHCPISFFEKTPSGRIISRFTSDLSAVDLGLGRFTDNCWQMFMILLAQIITVAILIPPILVIILISGIIYSFQAVAADRSNRVIKRAANLAMGPLQLSLSEHIDGKVLARLMKVNQYFDMKFYHALDQWTQYSFASLGILNTTMLTSYLLSLLISGSTAVFVVLTDSLSPSLAALALTYSFLIPYFLVFAGFVLSLLMTSLNSLERILDYVSDDLPQEPAWTITGESTEKRITTGKIEFRDVTLIYRKGLNPALSNLSFTINPKEKIGIIGRTGAGKSSIILLMLRIMDPTKGTVLVDDVDTKLMGLLNLRKSISIIPQTPLLLKGTVRENIAPFGKADFGDMKDALINSGFLHSFPKNNESQASSELLLKDNFSSSEVSEDEIILRLETDAESLSAGQKQLLSLARCLLNKDTKILILDEPTSNVDMATDKIVQQVVRAKFVNSTIITIAHRLETIADVDRIMVLEKGRLKRVGPPNEILKTEKL